MKQIKKCAGARFYSLQSKLTISSTAVILMMVVLLEVAVYTAVSRLQLRDAVQLNHELMQTMGNNFDNSVEAFERQINFITMNKEMQQTLRSRPETQPEKLQYGNLLRTSIVTNTLSLNEVDGVYLYDTQGTLLTFWQKKYRAGDPYIVLPHMQKDAFARTGDITPVFVGGRLVYNRAIRDMQTLDTLGYISFLYDADALRESIDTITPNVSRFVAVIDEAGQVIVHNSKSDALLREFVQKTAVTALPEDTFVELEQIGTALVSRYRCKTTGWNMICVVEKGQLVRSSKLTLVLVFCFGLTGVVLGALVQALCARRIVRPLRQMMDTVHRVEQGDYTAKVSACTTDEIKVLADSFNHMVDKIDVLVNRNLRGEIQYRDMQLLALQAQINPHFLYNTLECVNALAQMGRKDEVRRVTVAFSSLMKSLAKGPKTVCIHEELAYTEDFLVIYKTLLGDKLQYTLDAPDVFADVEIPRLILQPLVENAVLHGIKPSVQGGHVCVSVAGTPQGILLSILDDGVGMPPEKVCAIANYSAGMSTAEQAESIGLGVRNVIDRLRLVYGEAAVLTLQSSAAWGTTVDICIPLERGDAI